MKRKTAGLYLAAMELSEAVGEGDKKKVWNATRALRREADKFASDKIQRVYLYGGPAK